MISNVNDFFNVKKSPETKARRIQGLSSTFYKFKNIQGLEFSFPNSRIFKGIQVLYESCRLNAVREGCMSYTDHDDAPRSSLRGLYMI